MKKYNLGMTPIVLGMLLAPAVEYRSPGAAAIVPKGDSAVVLTAAQLPNPLPGSRWRVRITVASMGKATKFSMRYKSYAGPLTSREEISIPAGGGAVVSNAACASIVSITPDINPEAEYKVEYELIGVKAAADNEAVLAGISTSAASVPKNSAVEFADEGSVLAKIDPMVALVLGKEMTAGAAGIARPRVMGDAGAIVGTNKSASPVVLAGVSYAEIALDIREPA